MPFPPGAHLRPARPAAGSLAALLVAVLLVAAFAPAPAAAATTTVSVEASLLAKTNRDRAARGLRPLRLDSRLVGIADDRAANLAGAASFSHESAGGSLSAPLGRAGVQWYAWAENIAYLPGGLTSTTATSLYRLWRNSPAHWKALMSRSLNYVGFGVAVRPSDGRVFASAVFTESRDHTAPKVHLESASRTGTTITFAWHGWDPALQTHWSHLRDFDAWYRVDGGAWVLVRDNATATSLRLASLAPGHTYELTVRARDGAGNLGSRCRPIAVWVP
jgi:uncharacterized protein YkwD